MRKFYKFILGCMALMLFSNVQAQVLNQPANWPNTNWTVAGNYNATYLLADPIVDPNLSYDDDGAGSGSTTDEVYAESPVIDLTPANVAGENFIAVEYNFDYNDINSVFELQYWDADAASWQAWETLVENSSALSGWCAQISGPDIQSPILDITSFSVNQLQNFQYRFYYDASGSWDWGFCLSSPTIISLSCPDPSNLAVANTTTTSTDFSWDAGGNETMWNIEWGAPGFTPGTGAEDGAITGTSNNPETISGLTSSANGTDYDIYVQANCGGGDASNWVGPLNFTTAPSCPAPSNLAISNVTQDSATFSWDAGGSETMWNIEWGAPGFAPGTGAEDGAITGANNNPDTLSGLSPSTTYEVYVQADCGGGDESDWSGPITFTTQCGVFSTPFLESFTLGAEPNCWDSYSNDGSTSTNANWKFSGTPGYGASSNGKPGGTYAWVDGSTPDDDTSVLVSPMIDLSALTNPLLSFEIFSNNTDNPGDNMNFMVEIDNGVDTTLLLTYAADSSDWVLKQVDLSAYAGQTVSFIFSVDQTSTTGSAYYNDILLDEVAVCEAEDASFSYPSSQLCNQVSSVTPNITGMAGGTFDAPAGLVIDASTGEIDPSASTLGMYAVTYTSSTDPCRGIETVMVEVTDIEDASFAYADSTKCSNDNMLAANVTGLQGGTFSAGAGLDVDTNTGEIDPSGSTPGMYTVTYTSSGSACASSETFDIEIIEAEDASFNYGGTEFCINYEEVVPTITGDQGGEFWGEPGIAINNLTGQVGAEASTPGTYWVYYMTPGTECPATDSVEITIDECLGINENTMNAIKVYPNPANNVVNYVLPEMNGIINVTMIDATGKIVYETTTSGSTKSNKINVAGFENGIYMITFNNKNHSKTERIVISR